MEIVHMIVTALLTLLTLIGLVGLRIRLRLGNGAGALVGLFALSSVYVLTSGFYEHSWILLVASYIATFIGFRIPVLGPVLLSFGQLTNKIVRTGISHEKIVKGQVDDVVDLVTSLDINPALKDKMVKKYKDKVDSKS